jgi:crotonobetainyl-CoA:carnitine CoA-transferase CaiB-like acyl-CoA transferase
VFVDVEHPLGSSLRVPDAPVKLGGTPGGIAGPPQVPGEHTDEVLKALLGLSPDGMASLREALAVFGPLPSPVPLARECEEGVSWT